MPSEEGEEEEQRWPSRKGGETSWLEDRRSRLLSSEQDVKEEKECLTEGRFVLGGGIISWNGNRWRAKNNRHISHSKKTAWIRNRIGHNTEFILSKQFWRLKTIRLLRNIDMPLEILEKPLRVGDTLTEGLPSVMAKHPFAQPKIQLVEARPPPPQLKNKRELIPTLLNSTHPPGECVHPIYSSGVAKMRRSCSLCPPPSLLHWLQQRWRERKAQAVLLCVSESVRERVSRHMAFWDGKFPKGSHIYSLRALGKLHHASVPCIWVLSPKYNGRRGGGRLELPTVFTLLLLPLPENVGRGQ